MADKKLFIFDIDGTLLNDKGVVLDSTKEALKTLNETHEVAIATGRNRTMAMAIIEELNLSTYIVCNGAAAFYKNEAIYKNKLDPDEVKQLIDLADQNGHQIIYETVDDLKRRDAEPNDRVVNGMNYVGYPVPEQDRDFYKENDLVQCLIFYSEDEASTYEEDQFEAFRFVRWYEAGVDVLPIDGSKLNTIKRLADHMNIDMTDVIAFGDGLNDLEMIEHAGIGVAMGNAREEVKAVADLVTDTHTADGIVNALKEMKFI